LAALTQPRAAVGGALERRRAFAADIVNSDSGHLLTIDLLTYLHPALRAADLRAMAFGLETNQIGEAAITAMCENIVKPVVERVAREVRAAGDDVNVVLVVDGHNENYAKGATHARRGTSPRALESTIRAILTKVNQRNDHTLAQLVQSLLKRIPLLSTQSLLVRTLTVLVASSLLESIAGAGQSPDDGVRVVNTSEPAHPQAAPVARTVAGLTPMSIKLMQTDAKSVEWRPQAPSLLASLAARATAALSAPSRLMDAVRAAFKSAGTAAMAAPDRAVSELADIANNAVASVELPTAAAGDSPPAAVGSTPAAAAVASGSMSVSVVIARGEAEQTCAALAARWVTKGGASSTATVMSTDTDAAVHLTRQLLRAAGDSDFDARSKRITWSSGARTATLYDVVTSVCDKHKCSPAALYLAHVLAGCDTTLMHTRNVGFARWLKKLGKHVRGSDIAGFDAIMSRLAARSIISQSTHGEFRASLRRHEAAVKESDDSIESVWQALSGKANVSVKVESACDVKRRAAAARPLLHDAIASRLSEKRLQSLLQHSEKQAQERPATATAAAAAPRLRSRITSYSAKLQQFEALSASDAEAVVRACKKKKKAMRAKIRRPDQEPTGAQLKQLRARLLVLLKAVREGREPATVKLAPERHERAAKTQGITVHVEPPPAYLAREASARNRRARSKDSKSELPDAGITLAVSESHGNDELRLTVVEATSHFEISHLRVRCVALGVDVARAVVLPVVKGRHDERAEPGVCRAFAAGQVASAARFRRRRVECRQRFCQSASGLTEEQHS
jgi:hypothetical protein